MLFLEVKRIWSVYLLSFLQKINSVIVKGAVIMAARPDSLFYFLIVNLKVAFLRHRLLFVFRFLLWSRACLDRELNANCFGFKLLAELLRMKGSGMDSPRFEETMIIYVPHGAQGQIGPINGHLLGGVATDLLAWPVGSFVHYFRSTGWQRIPGNRFLLINRFSN